MFLYMYVWFRATLPRLRYDQLMDLGWKVLIPISLGWFLLLAAIRVRRTDDDWRTRHRVVVISLSLAAVVLSRPVAPPHCGSAGRNREARQREGAMS